jgi:hypothetical protein
MRQGARFLSGNAPKGIRLTKKRHGASVENLSHRAMGLKNSRIRMRARGGIRICDADQPKGLAGYDARALI